MKITKKTIRGRIVTLGISGVVTMAIALLTVTLFQKRGITQVIDADFEQTARRETESIAREVHLLCRTQHELMLEQIQQSLGIATNLLGRAGGLHLSTNSMPWTAINPYTQKSYSVVLPEMFAGSTSLVTPAKPGKEPLIVDEVTRITGGICAIYERINETGDMLRVCTSGKSHDSDLGALIPAVGLEQDPQTPNPIVQALLRGEPFQERSAATAASATGRYQPLFDQDHRVIGALYVGHLRNGGSNDATRREIMEIKVGKTGYVYVLGGRGAHRGHYIISKDGKADGRDIWDARDSTGKSFIQSIIGTGLNLKVGEVGFEKYPWKNEGEAKARNKIAAICYFEPSDWVICAGAYEDDFADTKEHLISKLSVLVKWIAICGLGLSVVIGALSFRAATNISRPSRWVCSY